MTKVANRREQDALVQAVGEHDAIGIDAKIRGGLDNRLAEVGIEGEPLPIERPHRLDHLRGAATGVLVEVKAKAGAEVGNALNGGHCRFLTSIERAWPSRPSALANVVTVSAIRLRPCFVIRCTDTSFTKSAAFSPPR